MRHQVADTGAAGAYSLDVAVDVVTEIEIARPWSTT
jgi:hypothetical protein